MCIHVINYTRVHGRGRCNVTALCAERSPLLLFVILIPRWPLVSWVIRWWNRKFFCCWLPMDVIIALTIDFDVKWPNSWITNYLQSSNKVLDPMIKFDCCFLGWLPSTSAGLPTLPSATTWCVCVSVCITLTDMGVCLSLSGMNLCLW